MLTKEISEVEKEIEEYTKHLQGKAEGDEEYLKVILGNNILLGKLKAKLSTLKSAQAKFNEELESIRVNAYTSGYSSATKREKAKFNKFVEEELEFLKWLWINEGISISGKEDVAKRIKELEKQIELSSKQEETC